MPLVGSIHLFGQSSLMGSQRLSDGHELLVCSQCKFHISAVDVVSRIVIIVGCHRAGMDY